jgi:hypothetical protein
MPLNIDGSTSRVDQLRTHDNVESAPQPTTTATSAPVANDAGTPPASVPVGDDPALQPSTAPAPEAPLEHPGDAEARAGLEGELDLRLNLLASSEDMFHAMARQTYGVDVDRGEVEALRQRILQGESGAKPALHFASAEELDGRVSLYDPHSNRIILDRALLADRDAAVRAYTSELGKHVGTQLPGVDPAAVDGGRFDAWVDPHTDPAVGVYQSMGPADESQPPFGLEHWTYGSLPPETGAVAFSEDHPAYINGAVGTPIEFAQLREGGAANMMNPAWLAEIDAAVARNGGLGNMEDGYLAVSKLGFVRLRNTNLTPEQNRQLAAISLQTGWPIEDLPARAGESRIEHGHIDQWFDNFVGDYSREFQDFLRNPTENGIHMQDGHRRFALEFKEEAGGFVSYNYKKSGGFRGFVQDNFKEIMYGVGAIATVLTMGGYAAVAGAVSSLASTAFSYVATGTLKASQAISAGVAGLTSMFGLGGTAAVAANAAGQVAGDLADDGDLDMDAGQIATALTPLIQGLPGGVVVDHAVRESVKIAAKLADGGKLSAQDVVSALAPLVLEMPAGSTRDKLAAIARDVDGGKLSAAQVAERIRPLIDSVTGDSTADRVLLESLELVAKVIDRGELGAEDFVGAFGDMFEAQLRELGGGRILMDALDLVEAGVAGRVNTKAAVNLFEDVTGYEVDDFKDWLFSSEPEPQPAAA